MQHGVDKRRELRRGWDLLMLRKHLLMRIQDVSGLHISLCLQVAVLALHGHGELRLE
jgi:hypothetical protein